MKLTVARPSAAKSSRGIAALAPVETATLHLQVYDALAKALMSGTFAPGERLSYQRIADQFGVSPMPVRDALRRLAAEGAVLIEPKRGVQVPEATLERIDDLSRVRVALEGLATELAAASMSAETLYKIDHLANQMMISAGSGKWQNYLAQNQEYHFLIYAASGSSILMRLIEGLWLQTGPLMTYFRMERAEQTQDEDALGLHHAVAEALRGGDAAQARRLVEDDVREGMDYLREVLRQSSS